MAKRYHDGEYAGHTARRTQEMQDAGMIHSDFSAIANLPQGVMIKPYPKVDHYSPEDLDDTISGVNHQMETLDGAQKMRHLNPKKV